MSAICGRHLDSVHHRPTDKDGVPKKLLPCRQNVAIVNDDGGSNLDAMVLQLKLWLVKGYEGPCHCLELEDGVVDADGPAGLACRGRQQHMSMKARNLSKSDVASILDSLPVGPGEFDNAELECLRS